jgi:hypothetical protein
MPFSTRASTISLSLNPPLDDPNIVPPIINYQLYLMIIKHLIFSLINTLQV